MLDRFPCTKCGVCCKNISHIVQLTNYDRGDGQCIYLQENKCSIYSTRPLVCRVKEMYVQYYKQHMSEEEFIYQNLLACRSLQEKSNVPISKYVVIPKRSFEKGKKDGERLF